MRRPYGRQACVGYPRARRLLGKNISHKDSRKSPTRITEFPTRDHTRDPTRIMAREGKSQQVADTCTKFAESCRTAQKDSAKIAESCENLVKSRLINQKFGQKSTYQPKIWSKVPLSTKNLVKSPLINQKFGQKSTYQPKIWSKVFFDLPALKMNASGLPEF